MVKLLLDGMCLSEERVIITSGGDIMHHIKASSEGFCGFGEVYFSRVDFLAVKAWKRHLKMTLNLVVPVGQVRFEFFDLRPESRTCGRRLSIFLGENSYQRLTVPPGIWFGFQGSKQGLNMLANLADIEHDPTEVERLAIDYFDVDWSHD